PEKIISRSSDPISAIFFCWIEFVVLVSTKKIAKIRPVNRKIIAKNDFSTPDQSDYAVSQIDLCETYPKHKLLTMLIKNGYSIRRKATSQQIKILITNLLFE